MTNDAKRLDARDALADAFLRIAEDFGVPADPARAMELAHRIVHSREDIESTVDFLISLVRLDAEAQRARRER